MVKVLRMLQNLILGVLILGSGIQEAKAFFLLPPMPWDIEVDVPANANKIVSNAKTLYRQAQTIKSELNSQKLEILKKGQAFLNTKFKKQEEGGKNKAPGRGELRNSSLLKITEHGLNEEENFNAFHTLFLVYPPKSSYPDNYPAAKVAYMRKADEYKQDVIMETYLTGRVTENYLALVEKTIERLDHCQKGLYTEAEMAEHCVFFGLQMAYVEPKKENLDNEGSPEESTNPGQYGEVLNAYIVTTVYDRLMRIVEDLTGTEAQFISAIQIDSVDPLEPEEQSSAEEYIEKGYKFAYNESKTYALATGQMLGGNYIRSQECANGGKNCPDENEDVAEIKNTDDTAILGKLLPIDEQLRNAMNLHNLKSKLDEYKTQYRKYLKSKEIHERMMKVLKKSEESVVSFLDRYSGGKGETIWYNGNKPAKVNEHENRGGLSKEVILEYQEDTTDKLIGTDTGECDGFYESCPDGYELDSGNPCVYTDNNGNSVTSATMFACVLKTVTSDTDPEGDPKVSFEPKLEENYSIAGANNQRDYNDTDYFEEGNQAEIVEVDNRVKAEKNWRIGYDKIMKLTEDGTLKFEPWNDQKNLQTEYLRNKYRNMRMIVKTADQGLLSQRVAKVLANESKNIGPIEEVLPAVSVCKLTTDATEDAFNQDCSDYSGSCSQGGDTASCSGTKVQQCYTYDSEGNISYYYVTLWCKVDGDNNTGKINGYKEVGCSKSTVGISYSQTIKSLSGGCDFTKAGSDYHAVEDTSETCPSKWDLTTKFLVRRYIPGVTASWINGGSYESQCQMDLGTETLDKENTHLYTNTNTAGRVVASDHFQELIEMRKELEKKLKAMVDEYEKSMQSLKATLRATIASRSEYGQKLSDKTDEKNELVQQRQRSLKRATAIIAQIEELNTRVAELQARLDERKPKPKSLQKEIESLTIGAGEDMDKFENPTLAQRIGQIPALKEELAFICYKAPTNDDDYKVCKEYSGTANKEEPYDENTREEDKFENVADLHTKITAKNTEIDSISSMMQVLQDRIDSLNEQIEQKALAFADNYVKTSEEGQRALEAANRIFENKLEIKEDGVSEPDRMVSNSREWCKGYGPLGVICRDGYSHEYKYDNLSWTIARVMYGNGSENSESAVAGELPELVKKGIEDRWFADGSWLSYAANKLSNEGKVVRKFVVEGGCLAPYGVADGLYTPTTLAKAIKEKSVEEAVADLSIGSEAYINKADKIIKDEIDAAVEEITDVMELWGVTGEEGTEANPAIFEHSNYADDGATEGTQSVTKTHYELLEDLKKAENQSILDAASIELKEIFGMPDSITTDVDYFAALPARGYFAGKDTYVQFGRDNEKFVFDENDGRDYRAPRKPLMNLAPIREVFYFSALDYDDVPQKDGKPSLSALVDVKYKNVDIASAKEVEYLPEAWRYLLATPNLRKGPEKYQHTFVERDYGLDKLKKYLNNENIDGAKEWHYRAIIGRGGVYPCNLGGRVIDVGGGDGVGDIQFKQRSNLPFDILKAEECQEVESYKGGVRQLLADHDTKDDSKSKALQGSLGGTTEPMYLKYSELGQFLNGDLQYRPILKNIYDYLLSEDNQENNIERQRAETAVFKRNVIGSFLESVNAEHTALKSLEKNEQEAKDSLKNLCMQLHNFDTSVNGESCEDKEDSECMESIAEDCAEFIMKNGGLAKDSFDDKYDVDCAQSGSGSYYETIFCKLNDLKDEAVKKAEEGYSDGENEYEGYNEVKGMEGSEKIEERKKLIENYLEIFKKTDADELSYVQPDATPEEVADAVEEAKANREASLDATEEGLTSMDNQSQAVPYAPVY